MTTLRTALSALALAALSTLGACAGPGSLEGEWEGTLDCSGGGYEAESFEVVLELEGSGNDYEGDGLIDLGRISGQQWDVVFELEVEKDKRFGAQDLELDVEDCTLELDGRQDEDLDCESMDEAEWDGADEIEGEVEDFLGLSWDCELLLER